MLFFPKRWFALPAYDPPCREAPSLSRIPRKIWQTNFSNQCTLPLILNCKHNRALSKGFEYHYVSTEEREKYLLTHAPMRVASAYKRLTDDAAQADLWRLVVLYNVGEIYMDIDATLVNNLGSIISGKKIRCSFQTTMSSQISSLPPHRKTQFSMTSYGW